MLLAATATAVFSALLHPSAPRPSPAESAPRVTQAPSMTATLSPPVNAALKLPLLQLAAALDRGQSFNPTSSDAYSERMALMDGMIEELIAASPPLPTELSALDGEWELVFTNVAHGIFRSSPFFLAIEDAYTRAGAPDKAQLFFKLHELQTCSWGISKIGRVAQRIDASEGLLYSEFDTNLLSLTTIPVIGFWKLLPTFGGCVVTVSSAAYDAANGKIDMEVQYTTSKPVPGLSGLRPLPGEWGYKIADLIWNLKVPVGAVWKLLPWNGGNPASCSVTLKYFDGDTRIVEDSSGAYFVYARAVAPRG